MCVNCSIVPNFVTPWTVARQAPLSKGFSREEYWSGLPFPSSRDLPDPGIKPWAPTLEADSLPSEPPGKLFFFFKDFFLFWLLLFLLSILCDFILSPYTISITLLLKLLRGCPKVYNIHSQVACVYLQTALYHFMFSPANLKYPQFLFLFLVLLLFYFIT